MLRIIIGSWIVTLGTVSQIHAQAALSVTPAYAVITDEKPYGAFVLYNQGTEDIEVTIRAHYGVIASTDSTTEVVLGEAGQLRDLTEHLTFFPDRAILVAGSEQTVRYRIHEAQEGAHIALIHFAMQERGAILNEQIPVVASGLSIVYNLVAPLVYFQGRGMPVLSAKFLEYGSGELYLSIENQSSWPFLGGIRVVQDGNQLGRAESAIYTKRLVRIPIFETPNKGQLRLEFDTEYTGLSMILQRQLGTPMPIELNMN